MQGAYSLIWEVAMPVARTAGLRVSLRDYLSPQTRRRKACWKRHGERGESVPAAAWQTWCVLVSRLMCLRRN